MAINELITNTDIPPQDEPPQEANPTTQHAAVEQVAKATIPQMDGHTMLQRFPDYGWESNNSSIDLGFHITVPDTYCNAKLNNALVVNLRTYDNIKEGKKHYRILKKYAIPQEWWEPLAK